MLQVVWSKVDNHQMSRTNTKEGVWFSRNTHKFQEFRLLQGGGGLGRVGGGAVDA